MGIRIHKILGYGWTDFKGWDKDPRINPLNSDMDSTWDDFFKWAKKLHAELTAGKKDDETFRDDRVFSLILLIKMQDALKKKTSVLYDSVYYDDEFGDPNVIVFTIPWNKWNRYDDTLDYYEYYGQYDEMKPKTVLLNRPIYPYESWVDVDGRELDHRKKETFLQLKTLEMFLKNKKDIPKLRHSVATDLGYRDYEEALKKVVPIVPQDIFILNQYLRIIKNDSDVRTLKPMIYTYWS